MFKRYLLLCLSTCLYSALSFGQMADIRDCAKSLVAPSLPAAEVEVFQTSLKNIHAYLADVINHHSFPEESSMMEQNFAKDVQQLNSSPITSLANPALEKELWELTKHVKETLPRVRYAEATMSKTFRKFVDDLDQKAMLKAVTFEQQNIASWQNSFAAAPDIQAVVQQWQKVKEQVDNMGRWFRYIERQNPGLYQALASLESDIAKKLTMIYDAYLGRLAQIFQTNGFITARVGPHPWRDNHSFLIFDLMKIDPQQDEFRFALCEKDGRLDQNGINFDPSKITDPALAPIKVLVENFLQTYQRENLTHLILSVYVGDLNHEIPHKASTGKLSTKGLSRTAGSMAHNSGYMNLDIDSLFDRHLRSSCAIVQHEFTHLYQGTFHQDTRFQVVTDDTFSNNQVYAKAFVNDEAHAYFAEAQYLKSTLGPKPSTEDLTEVGRHIIRADAFSTTSIRILNSFIHALKYAPQDLHITIDQKAFDQYRLNLTLPIEHLTISSSSKITLSFAADVYPLLNANGQKQLFETWLGQDISEPSFELSIDSSNKELLLNLLQKQMAAARQIQTEIRQAYHQLKTEDPKDLYKYSGASYDEVDMKEAMGLGRDLTPILPDELDDSFHQKAFFQRH